MPGRGEPLTGYRKLCPVCGKEFWAFADWRYRRMDKATRSKTYYCSWKCIRATEIREEEAKQAEELLAEQSRCLICGETLQEEGSGRICGECKGSVLFVRKIVQMIEERKNG